MSYNDDDHNHPITPTHTPTPHHTPHHHTSQIAQEILQDADTEAITGDRLVEILDATSLCPVLPYAANGATNLAASVPPRTDDGTTATATAGQGDGGGALGSVATAGESGFAGGPTEQGSRVGSVSFTRMREGLAGVVAIVVVGRRCCCLIKHTVFAF